MSAPGGPPAHQRRQRGLKLTLTLPRAAPALVDLDLDLALLAFDCDDDADSPDSADSDGYVSVLRRPPARSPAPAASPAQSRARRPCRPPRLPRERYQSITAIPGLGSTNFEELRLETYMQSLVATGTARPHPAFSPAAVIPPAFSAPFVDGVAAPLVAGMTMPLINGGGVPSPPPADADVEMPDA
ncbi:hypothetical protein C8J57DRAFT_1652119 [Mycena rebaudengoi]|nr:hypothetical protein C8J57DRAFT_1652119 [Mycena rebaudengoi]